MSTPLDQLNEAMRLLALAQPGLANAATGKVIPVLPGGDVQAALNKVRVGDSVVLTAGAVYPGSFILPVFPAGAGMASLTTSAALPNGRIDPSQAQLLAKLQAPVGGDPALRTVDGSHHWLISGIEVLGNPQGFNDLVRLGDGSTAQVNLSQVPHDLIIDRCYLHGDPLVGQKRGIAWNCATSSILNSYLSDFKVVGQDSQAVEGWNGPGPYVFTNNYCEAAGENLLFGGADAAIPNLVPSDILVNNNVFTKPLAWRTQAWQVKNLFELKSARRVRFEHNDCSNCWGPTQGGYALQITPRNQDGAAPWSTVEDVLISANTFRAMAGIANLLGFDDGHKSGVLSRVQILGNSATALDPWAWGGNDKVFQMLAGPIDVTIDGNVISGQHFGSILYFDGAPKCLRTVFTNNKFPLSQYGGASGVFGGGSSTAPADPPRAWVDYVTGGTIGGNVITA